MSTWEVKVAVDYSYEVEADSKEEAEAEGWKYEDYRHFGSVDFIKVKWLGSDEDE